MPYTPMIQLTDDLDNVEYLLSKQLALVVNVLVMGETGNREDLNDFDKGQIHVAGLRHQ